MNFKYSFTVFFLLNILTSNSIIQVSEDWILVKEEDSICYKIRSFNEDLADEYLGGGDIEDVFGKNAQVGACRYYKLENIDFYDDLHLDDENKTFCGWLVDITMWNWMKYDKWKFYEKRPNKIYESLTIYADPIDLGQAFENIELLIPPYFVPDPVDDYLESINWLDDFKVEGKVISHKFEEIKGKKLKMIYEFGSNGFLLNQKLLTDNTYKIIYEYGVDDEPFSFNFLFIILGVFVLSVVIIEFIYIIIKKFQFLKKDLKKNKGDSDC